MNVHVLFFFLPAPTSASSKDMSSAETGAKKKKTSSSSTSKISEKSGRTATAKGMFLWSEALFFRVVRPYENLVNTKSKEPLGGVSSSFGTGVRHWEY